MLNVDQSLGENTSVSSQDCGLVLTEVFSSRLGQQDCLWMLIFAMPLHDAKIFFKDFSFGQHFFPWTFLNFPCFLWSNTIHLAYIKVLRAIFESKSSSCYGHSECTGGYLNGICNRIITSNLHLHIGPGHVTA